MKYGYIIVIVVVAIVIFNSLTKVKEPFTNVNNNKLTKWSPDLIKRFNIYQTTVNENVATFDLDQLQRQVRPEEVETYLKQGFWDWDDELKQSYINHVWANPVIKIDPHYALNHAMKIYNKTAARELIAWNEKEGHFLLYGADIGVSDGLPKDIRNTVKCGVDGTLEKTVYTGLSVGEKVVTKVAPNDVTKVVPGFSFVKGTCNPCVALNETADFTCPFRLNVDGDDSISENWSYLWGIKK